MIEHKIRGWFFLIGTVFPEGSRGDGGSKGIAQAGIECAVISVYLHSPGSCGGRVIVDYFSSCSTVLRYCYLCSAGIVEAHIAVGG